MMAQLFSNFNPVKVITSIAFLTFTVQVNMAVERAHIVVNSKQSTESAELVITKGNQDPASSEIRTKPEPGIYEFDIEIDNIELYHLIDWTELINNHSTSHIADFLIEDGAEITLTFDGDKFLVQSTGKEQQAIQKMETMAKEKFEPRKQELRKIEDQVLRNQVFVKLLAEEKEWAQQYYIDNPMIYYLLELDQALSSPRLENHSLHNQLQVYHDYYLDKYPEHPVHKNIADNEKRGFQIFGGKYNDYDVRTLGGEKVRGYDFMKPGYNLVVLWATWCAPCRRQAQEIAQIIDPYMEAGLNVFALTREFDNTDKVKEAVEKDNYPWPTLVDLDNEFKVFDLHGASSSGVFLINPEGEIVFTGHDRDKVKEALDKYIATVK